MSGRGAGAEQGPAAAAASAGAAAAAPCRLAVRHETRYEYDTPVELAHHLAHLCPRDTPMQAVSGWDLQIDPPPDGGMAAGRDGWGNARHLFTHVAVHQHLQVVSTFVATVRAGAAAPPPSPAWEDVAETLRYQAGRPLSEAAEFALASPFAARSARLAAFAAASFTPGRPLADAAWAFNAAVHAHFEYASGATSVATPAHEAFDERRGVCQDYAHVMIAALRSIGLAARYVSGYLLTQPPPGQPRLLGADASHAWVEVWTGAQWWALDPTNAIACSADHVTLAWGRDYADVAPLRGVVRGGGRSQPQVAVSVLPVGQTWAPPS